MYKWYRGITELTQVNRSSTFYEAFTHPYDERYSRL